MSFVRGPTDLHRLVQSHAGIGHEPSSRAALELLDGSTSTWHRNEFSPGHFTASGFVASPDGTKLLLIHHARLGRWLQPGGHIEADDLSIEDAARREVAEETGIGLLDRKGEGIIRIDAHPIPERSDEPAHMHIDLAVGFIAGTFDIGPLDEVLDAAWVPFVDLGSFDTDDAVRRGADALRALLT